MTRENAADILCIGAQRSMTSWLHNVMAAHPDTWTFPNFNPVTSTTKEAHYWDRNHRHGPDWYRVLMRPLRDDRKSLDFTPEYAFMDETAISECKSLNPTARVLYILRDPLARSISAIRMHTMWETKSRNAEDHTITYGPAFLARCKRARLLLHNNYIDNVARWRKEYPEMIILNYEDVAADPVASAEQIVTDCGLTLDALSVSERSVFEQRARRINWPTVKFAIDPECVQFLHGLVYPESSRIQKELGLKFSESDPILEASL